MAKGQVYEWEIRKAPPYFYFSNGYYNNPQTHPVFVYFAEKYSWWEEWDFEDAMEGEEKVTYLKLTAPLLLPQNIEILYEYGFEYHNPKRFNI